MTSATNFSLAETSVNGLHKENDRQLRTVKTQTGSTPPWNFTTRQYSKLTLPNDILGRIDLIYSFKPMHKDGELVIPIICLYHCE
jgi:hypothetical protein